ncbi:hypothetical protein PFMALIP_04915 [Plasmodium falciparum MaliPS096_E11]|uniref:Uncharacterized protein n=1 Tax=Plasmodium falciparum MaliPS096_E11 TaxID=1036727 RepID=A0A024WJT1_PLAFA|nr:hypothetical protein PFMALIP_04915 [Plasmodium falciparum MaliPS096_E11]
MLYSLNYFFFFSLFRNSFGYSIDAACGQLYADYEPKKRKEKIESKNMSLLL